MLPLEGKCTWKGPHPQLSREWVPGSWWRGTELGSHQGGGTQKRSEQVSEKNFISLSTVPADALGMVGDWKGPQAPVCQAQHLYNYEAEG